MFLSLLVLGFPGPDPAPWRNFDEVFDLAVVDGKPVAATNGGLLEMEGDRWIPIASPSNLRSIDSLQPLEVRLADGREMRRSGDRWTAASLEGRSRSLRNGLLLNPADEWNFGGSAPPAHPYSLLELGNSLYAGANRGLFVREDGADWTPVPLPSAIPIPRPNGIAEAHGVYVVGGLGGLYIGKPGDWVKLCDDSIRQISSGRDSVWVAHGNGALDKLSVKDGQLWPDVLSGAARRPWTSCIGQCGDAMLFGGEGGWVERGPHPSEHYPASLQGDVVLSIVGSGNVRWVGTEKSGLIRFAGKSEKAWNPGNGLSDTTVSALLPTEDGVILGTGHDGLYRVSGSTITPVEGPSKRITSLLRWNGELVVGAMDGGWVHHSNEWKPLDTNGEETTSLALVDGELAVTTASGVYRFSSF